MLANRNKAASNFTFGLCLARRSKEMQHCQRVVDSGRLLHLVVCNEHCNLEYLISGVLAIIVTIAPNQKWKTLGPRSPHSFSLAHGLPLSPPQPLRVPTCSQCWSMSLAILWALLTPRLATQWWGRTTRGPPETLSTTAWELKIWSTSLSSMVRQSRPFSQLSLNTRLSTMRIKGANAWLAHEDAYIISRTKYSLASQHHHRKKT